jgi:hypothetical protein
MYIGVFGSLGAVLIFMVIMAFARASREISEDWKSESEARDRAREQRRADTERMRAASRLERRRRKARGLSVAAGAPVTEQDPVESVHVVGQPRRRPHPPAPGE